MFENWHSDIVDFMQEMIIKVCNAAANRNEYTIDLVFVSFFHGVSTFVGI